jgi:thiol-disulfide isomerase/thioredoxin
MGPVVGRGESSTRQRAAGTPLDQEETPPIMRFKSFPRPLWLLPVAALGLGCTSTGGFSRTSQEPKITTIASIGDRSVAAVAGVPSSSAVADLDPPEPKRDRNARVAGRVVDDRGEPVAGALVRLGVGGTSGGRVIEATTDRAGGFTLNGLRPGSTYTLIAELDGKDGGFSGRWVGRSPQTNVEIALQADGLPDDRRRAGKTPAARTISGSRPVDESVSDETGARSKINPDDLAAGSDVEDIDDLAAAPLRPTRTGAVAVSGSGSGWRKSKVVRSGVEAMASSSDGATRRASNTPANEADDDGTTIRVPRRTVEEPPVAIDDESDNPLPPAIEPEAPRQRAATRDKDPDPVEPTRPRTSQRTPVVNTSGPGTQPGALTLADDTLPLEPPLRKPKRPVATPPTSELTTSPDPAASNWSQLPAAETPPITDQEPAKPKKSTWAAMASAWSAPATPEPPLRDRPEVRQADYVDQLPAVATALPRRDAIELCRYDAKRQQILNFRLPNLAGQPVTLADFHSDYILLDFWGTWCRPCMTSVPHFVELQNRIGSKSLSIVGIACEEGPPTSNAAHVADVAKRLGINYDILISSKDAPSPLQQSLHIQAFPTMILIDRNGRLLWRGTGATATTLARLDRVLDSATRNAGSDTVRR